MQTSNHYWSRIASWRPHFRQRKKPKERGKKYITVPFLTFVLTRIHVDSSLLFRYATRTGILLTPAHRGTENLDYRLVPATSRRVKRLREVNDGGSLYCTWVTCEIKTNKVELPAQRRNEKPQCINITKGLLRSFKGHQPNWFFPPWRHHTVGETG